MVAARPSPADEPEIRPLQTRAELEACVALQHEIWGAHFNDLVPPSILKVVQRIGGVSLGAFDADGRLLGFVFGLTGVERGRIVHWSDMLAVREEARNQGIGRRLKLRQREVVRAHGAVVIYWTFDPLVARNAHLNFNRFGVTVAEYVEDMYGSTGSTLHGTLPTDRLVVAWPTRAADADVLVAESRRLRESDDCRDAPYVTEAWIASHAAAAELPLCIRVEVPGGDEPIQRDDPGSAMRWRLDVRRAMKWGLAAGFVVSGFHLASDGGGYYILTRPAASRAP